MPKLWCLRRRRSYYFKPQQKPITHTPYHTESYPHRFPDIPTPTFQIFLASSYLSELSLSGMSWAKRILNILFGAATCSPSLVLPEYISQSVSVYLLIHILPAALTINSKWFANICQPSTMPGILWVLNKYLWNERVMNTSNNIKTNKNSFFLLFLQMKQTWLLPVHKTKSWSLPCAPFTVWPACVF